MYFGGVVFGFLVGFGGFCFICLIGFGGSWFLRGFVEGIYIKVPHEPREVYLKILLFRKPTKSGSS